MLRVTDIVKYHNGIAYDHANRVDWMRMMELHYNANGFGPLLMELYY